MAESVSVKINALEILERQLYSRAKKKQYGVIVLSSATDPYLQFEKETLLTVNILKLILKYRFPLHVITKSDLVVRDLDLLEEINRSAILPADLEGRLNQRVFITFSFSTLNDSISKIFEPGAPLPDQRIDAFKKVVERKFLCGINLMPLLPYISDTGESLELMFNTFSEIGAHYIFPATLTLFGDGPSDSKTLVLRAIKKYYPHLLGKYSRFFSEFNELPTFYNQAFYNKTKELSIKYNLRNSII
jgi:DNA repair photolyase